jgi:cytochrome c oxidase subunit 1
LMIVYRSGIRWDMSTRLLFISLFGWAIGVIPAFIDGTITVNYIMHNTMWVPGHFHIYLLLGMMTMVFGFMYYLGKPEQNAQDSFLDRAAFWGLILGTLGFSLNLLYSGMESVPRRFAVHLPEWLQYDRYGSIFAILIIASVLVFIFQFLTRLGLSGRDYPRASLARNTTV